MASTSALLQEDGGWNNPGISAHRSAMASSSASASASALLQEAGGFPSTIPFGAAFLLSLPRQWRDFQRSRPPRKMCLLGEGSRGQHDPNPLVREAFAAGKPIVELVLRNGYSILHDFLRKAVLVLDGERKIKKSFGLSWVDDDGFTFSPSPPGCIEEEFVKEAFLKHSGGRLTIRALRRCHYREDRVTPFLAKMEVRVFGWYGASAANVEAAANGGALTANWNILGAERAHGRGVHVSALDELLLGASLSLQATGGAPASVLFCAMAPGCQEIVPAGSSQSESSSSFFHSGTDAIARQSDVGVTKSKWSIFWERCEKTSILPLYKVSFVTV